MNNIKNISIINKAIAETIWPTRCAICDRQGYLLCPKCSRKLPYIDQLKTCSKCGEPFGSIQCCGCNDQTPFDKCVSVFFLNNDTGKIITTYKDGGERRLAYVIAYFLHNAINPGWTEANTYITYIPSSKEAYIRRGFDHAKLIAENLSKLQKIKMIDCFNRPTSNDQRKLSRVQRSQNLSGKFEIKSQIKRQFQNEKTKIILIDDVFTTGATLSSASLCLKANGFNKVYCVNFSRTF